MYRLLFVVVLFIVSGCASVTEIERGPTRTEHVYEKNYDIGIEKSAYIGEEIIKVKDYYILKSPVQAMRAKNDFKISAALSPAYYGASGTTYPIVGKIKQGSDTINLIQVPYFGLRVGVTQKRNFAGVSVGELNQKLVGVSYDPLDTEFELVNEEKVDHKSTFVNYEIIFTGLSGQSINLLYREYTSENMARPAFYQNLTYPLDSNYIRFKRLKINVLQIDNEKMKYKVVQDGISG